MSEKRLSILFVSHSSGFGGAERCLLSLLESLDRDRFRPVVAVPDTGEMANWLVARQIAVRQTPLRWWLGIRDGSSGRRLLFARDLRFRVEKLARLIEAEKIDVVFSNTLVIVEAALAARMVGRPHIWHALEMLSRDHDLRALFPIAQFHRVLDKLTDRLAVVSESVAEELRPHLSEGKLRVVHTGIETDDVAPRSGRKGELFGVSEDVPVVSYVGLLSNRKGVLTLARAAKEVITKIPNARFALAGADGGMGRELRKWISANGLRESIRLMGYRRDALDIVANSEVFVLPSIADPLPVAVLEAMKLGKPVIATRSGGCSEMVVDGETGFLVRSNDPNAMAAAILRMLDDPGSAQQMGERGRLRVTKAFRMRDCVQAFQYMFEEAAALDCHNDSGHTALSVLRDLIAATETEEPGVLQRLGSIGIRCREELRSNPIGAAYRIGRRLLGHGG